MPYLIFIKTGERLLVSEPPVWSRGVWSCGDRRFVDADRNQYREPAPTVGPNEFYFLWTMTEQVAIEQLRQVDDGVKLFMRRLDDPRTTEVVLSDPAVESAVRHTVGLLVDKGVIAEAEAGDRIAAILAGPVK